MFFLFLFNLCSYITYLISLVYEKGVIVALSPYPSRVVPENSDFRKSVHLAIVLLLNVKRFSSSHNNHLIDYNLCLGHSNYQRCFTRVVDSKIGSVGRLIFMNKL